MERTSVSFTIILLAHASAHAAHPSHPTPTPTPTATSNSSPIRLVHAVHAAVALGDFVGSVPTMDGLVLARQLVSVAKEPSQRSRSRVVYMNRGGTVLWPGDNDARLNLSSIVQEPVSISSWDIDDATWADTMACMTAMYARWDLVITDRDPGDVPHIEAIFGGHPSDVGLPDNVAGVSPFTSDCSNIESSVVFTFTDVLPDDPQLMCEVMAQEIAHSFGLDHELLAEDPMSYLDYADHRTFQDVDAACGEYEDRPCGIAGNVCRDRQNSVALLDARLGLADPSGPGSTASSATSSDPSGGCDAGGASGDGSARSVPIAGTILLLLGLLKRRLARRARA